MKSDSKSDLRALIVHQHIGGLSESVHTHGIPEAAVEPLRALSADGGWQAYHKALEGVITSTIGSQNALEDAKSLALRLTEVGWSLGTRSYQMATNPR